MEVSSIPSVLVIRSMCVPSADSLERTSDVNTADSANTNDEDAVRRILQRTLTSLPLMCDITVLPEIPVEPTTNHEDLHRRGHSSLDQGPLSLTRGAHLSNDSIRMERQALHPCGMYNVFLLHDLPHAGDPAAYLLSMTSCGTMLTHLDTPNGVIEIDPITVSVQAVPSTFSFAFENVSASAELNVNFDFSVALDRLEGIVKDNRALRDGVMDKDETCLHENPPVCFEETKEKCQNTKEHVYEGEVHHPTQHHDQLLHVLHELAEKESRHLDWMLVGLGFVFILLMVHYARTVLPLIRTKRSLKKRKKVTSFTDQSESRVSDSRGAQGVNSLEDGVETKKHGNRPPVNSVMFNRQDALTQEVPTLSFEPREVITPSEQYARSTFWKPPFDASTSPIGLNESLSLSSHSPREVNQISFLPANYSPSRHESKGTHDNRDLSPCSRLAQRWMQTKEKRRVSRKDHTGSAAGTSTMIQPSTEALFRKDESDIMGRINMVDGNPNLPTLAHDLNAIEAMNSAVGESKTPPLVCRSVERKVTTPDSLGSEESFLQDYWGE